MNKLIAIVGMCGSGKSQATDELEHQGWKKIYFGGVTYKKMQEEGIERTPDSEKIFREELRKKYNVDDIFKKKDISSNMEAEPENINKLSIKVKYENIFKRLFDCVLKFFNKE